MVLCVGKKGYYMGDYIFFEELEKFLVKCNDVKVVKVVKVIVDCVKI